MGLPVSIRQNLQTPFPALVQGGAYISVSKSNGKFTISVDYTKLLPLQTVPDATKKLVVINDVDTGVFNTFSVAAIANAAAALVNTSGLSGAILNNYRVVSAAGDVTILSTDSIILLDKSAGAPTNIVLPASASRQGVPVTVKDLKGDANTNNITFVPALGETIDGFSAADAVTNGLALVDVNYGKKQLFPLTSGGWYI